MLTTESDVATRLFRRSRKASRRDAHRSRWQITAHVVIVAYLGALAPYASQAQVVEFEAAAGSSEAEPAGQKTVGRAGESEETLEGPDEALRADADTGQAVESRADEPERPIQREALPSGPAKSAVTPQAISLPSGEGSIEGMGESFTPDLSSGTGTFSVPIALPPGRAGVQPSLALSYSTAGGNSSVGFGWGLDVPFIARQTDRGLPRYVEAANGLWHPEEDTFTYNGGQELVPVKTADTVALDGAPVPAEFAGWQQYRARVEGSFMRFFRSPDGLSWVVQDKAGMRFDFGALQTGDGPNDATGASMASLVSEVDGGSGRIFRWNLSRTSDAHGSAVYFQYLEDQGQRYLANIFYLSPSTCATTAPEEQRRCAASLESYGRRVRFVYESRHDVFVSYVPTWPVATALRLKRLEVTSAEESESSGRSLVRRFHLRYEASSFHSLLSEVQVEGRPDALSTATEVVVGDRMIPEGSLADQAVGHRLPPMRFTYSAPLASSSVTPGFGGIDATVHASPSSPPHSVDEARSDLYDVNSDGLPDLIVTDPARYRTSDDSPAVGVFFNGFVTDRANVAVAGAFSAAVPVPMPSGQSGVMHLANLNVAPMDIDGDGRSDLLHMPRVAEYAYFTPTRGPEGAIPEISPADQGWRWSQVDVELASGATDPRVDFGRDSTFLKSVDVNNDHLIDIVKTTGTVMQTWLNLGWLPGGDGLFGSATHTSAGWTLSADPTESCILQAGQPIDFEDPEVRLADMNGDGIQDIVKIRKGRVLYWPGRGLGLWGDGPSTCAQNEGSGREIEMDAPPVELNAELESVFLEDVNQDGAADVVQIRSGQIDVWFNKAGHGFTPRVIGNDTPFAPAFARQVRFADIDGTGTSDIVYAQAGNYQWIDPMGGQRPRLLERVDNGLGGVTALEYGSSSQDYLRDLADADQCQDSTCERFTWSQLQGDCDIKIIDECAYRSGSSPVLSTVVRAVERSDSFDRLGYTPNVMRTEFAYHDAYYEGIEQEFRGFGAADATDLGDGGHPTVTTRTRFLQGRRPNDIASDRLADNPNEALKGQAFLTEAFDLAGTYLSTSHTAYTVRRLLDGLNGTAVTYAFASRTDEVFYDVAGFGATPGVNLTWDDPLNGESNAFPAIVRETAGDDLVAVIPGVVETRTIALRAASRHAHTVTTVDSVDNAGNVRQQTAHGRVRGEFGAVLPNESIVSSNVPVLVPPAENWLWRTAASALNGHGDDGTDLNRTLNAFGTTGDLLLSTQVVEVGPGVPDYEFAGLPSGSSTLAGAIEDVVVSHTYDTWGNRLRTCAGGDVAATLDSECLRLTTLTYDPAYSLFAEGESTAVSRSGGTLSVLTTQASWDRGLGRLLTSTDPNGQVSTNEYDGLGRITSMQRPAVVGCGDEVPTARIQYDLASQGLPISLITLTTEQSCDGIGADPLTKHSYIDGLGRTRVMLLQAEDEGDPDVASRWQRSGFITFDARGAAREVFQPDFVGGSLESGAPAPPSALAVPSVPSTFQVYDAFGRPTLDVAEDGSTTRTDYHALSTDVWDPLDQDPSSAHFGTFASLRSDGHGRVIDEILRNRLLFGATVEYHRLWIDYRADDQVVRVARLQTTTDAARAESVALSGRVTERHFFYDSIGRRVGSVDPDTDSRAVGATAANKSWRYLYNRVSDLVAVRDPRGCGQNLFYDHAGRIVGEKYVGCSEAQSVVELSSESLPTGAIALDEDPSAPGPARAADVLYYFDTYPPWFTAGEGFPALPLNAGGVQGRATAILDRGQRSILAYDDRGNVTWTARQLAVLANAGSTPVTLGGNPPAIQTGDTISPAPKVYDLQHTYIRESTFDHASRPRDVVLPRDPDFGASPPRIGGTLRYNARGLPNAVTLQVDGTSFPIVKRVDYTRDGLVQRTVFGDSEQRTRPPTVAEATYDARRRPESMKTLRAPTVTPDGTRPLNAVTTLTDQHLVWDRANNLLAVNDWRDGAEWPAGFRPISYTIAQDSLYRVAQVDYDYTQDNNTREPDDAFVNYRSEMSAVEGVDPMRTRPAPMLPAAPSERPISITYEYDWLANMVDWSDDAAQFGERSLGRISNGFDEAGGRPSALRLASDLPTTAPTSGAPPGGRGGWIELDYGTSGNVTALTVHARCADVTTNSCYDHVTQTIEQRRASLRSGCTCVAEQHYQYRWDEVSRLVEARRYDRTGTGNWSLATRQRYRYDASNARTVKQTMDPGGAERIALYVYSGDFERRGLVRAGGGTQYAASAPLETESQYLVGGARIVWKTNPIENMGLDKDVRITVPITDAIGSTTAVIDVLSGDVVETAVYYPNGAHESYRAPDVELIAREPSGFTAKEHDEEVGLVYFGERYLIPRIGRWASPDPLSIHAVTGSEVLNSFHYVSGNMLQGRDPLGLDEAMISPSERTARSTSPSKDRDTLQQARTFGKQWEGKPSEQRHQVFASGPSKNTSYAAGRGYGSTSPADLRDTVRAWKDAAKASVDSEPKTFEALIEHLAGTGATTKPNVVVANVGHGSKNSAQLGVNGGFTVSQNFIRGYREQLSIMRNGGKTQFTPMQQAFHDIGASLRENGVNRVDLATCNVGGMDGAQFQQELANAWGVTIRAPMGDFQTERTVGKPGVTAAIVNEETGVPGTQVTEDLPSSPWNTVAPSKNNAWKGTSVQTGAAAAEARSSD